MLPLSLALRIDLFRVLVHGLSSFLGLRISFHFNPTFNELLTTVLAFHLLSYYRHTHTLVHERYLLKVCPPTGRREFHIVIKHVRVAFTSIGIVTTRIVRPNLLLHEYGCYE